MRLQPNTTEGLVLIYISKSCLARQWGLLLVCVLVDRQLQDIFPPCGQENTMCVAKQLMD